MSTTFANEDSPLIVLSDKVGEGHQASLSFYQDSKTKKYSVSYDLYQYKAQKNHASSQLPSYYIDELNKILTVKDLSIQKLKTEDKCTTTGLFLKTAQKKVLLCQKSKLEKSLRSYFNKVFSYMKYN